jgi:hypothetical protein
VLTRLLWQKLDGRTSTPSRSLTPINCNLNHQCLTVLAPTESKAK